MATLAAIWLVGCLAFFAAVLVRVIWRDVWSKRRKPNVYVLADPIEQERFNAYMDGRKGRYD